MAQLGLNTFTLPHTYPVCDLKHNIEERAKSSTVMILYVSKHTNTNTEFSPIAAVAGQFRA